MNNENLIPFSERSKEEARECGRKGGVNSGVTRRRKKTLRELAEIIGEKTITIKQPDGTKIDVTYDYALVSELFKKAIVLGDVSAAKTLINLKGEEQVANGFSVNIIGDEKTKKIIDELK